jgi:hypothetical protein
MTRLAAVLTLLALGCSDPAGNSDSASAGQPGSGGSTASGGSSGSGGTTSTGGSGGEGAGGVGGVPGPAHGCVLDGEANGAAVLASPYFALLAACDDCHVAYSLRSQAELDGITTNGEGPKRWPVIHDPASDSMLTRTGGVNPDTGEKMSLNAEQKNPTIKLQQTSMLLTWDFKLGPTAAWKGEGYLEQYKAWRLDSGSELDMWITEKLNFHNAVKQNQGIAEMFLTGSGGYLAPGATQGGSETLEPRLTRFFVEAETWTRVWIFVDGKLGAAAAKGSEVTYISTWAADEQRDPIHIHDRMPRYSPTGDVRRFRFEFNSSEYGLLNTERIDIRNRNMVVLAGVTLDDVEGMLEKPTP